MYERLISRKFLLVTTLKSSKRKTTSQETTMQNIVEKDRYDLWSTANKKITVRLCVWFFVDIIVFEHLLVNLMYDCIKVINFRQIESSLVYIYDLCLYKSRQTNIPSYTHISLYHGIVINKHMLEIQQTKDRLKYQLLWKCF